MKVRILSVGNKMPSWVQSGFDEYYKRIQPMLTTDIVELAAAKRAKNPSDANLAQYRETEGSRQREKVYVEEAKVLVHEEEDQTTIHHMISNYDIERRHRSS